jgi:hypothetical protein
MTRGQDSLVMELHGAGAAAAVLTVDVSRLPLVLAAADELAAHEAVLDQIMREAKSCVWRDGDLAEAA